MGFFGHGFANPKISAIVSLPCKHNLPIQRHTLIYLSPTPSRVATVGSSLLALQERQGGRMERVALLRSLSCSTTAYRRLLFRPRSASRLFSSNLCRPRPQELQLRALSCSGASRWRPGPAPPLRLRRRFSPSIRAISTSPSPVSRGAGEKTCLLGYPLVPCLFN